MEELIIKSGEGEMSVAWGSSVMYESNTGDSFEIWWHDLWPDAMETIRNCKIWIENDLSMTYEELESMMTEYDEKESPYVCMVLADGERVPVYAVLDLDHLPHHYMNH